MRLILLLFPLLMLPALAHSQSVEDEVGFIYVKAEYLYQTERYAEAIQQYSSIISADPTYEDALEKRAASKYYTGDFRGAKSDLMEAIRNTGVTKNVVSLLGLTEFELGNYAAAAGSLSLSYESSTNDINVVEALAQSYYNMDKMDEACQMAKRAKALGSRNGSSWARKYCDQVGSGEVVQAPKSGKKELPGKTGKKDIPVIDNEDEILIEDSEDENKDEMVVDDTETTIDVDEDLKLVMKNGIGSRKIMDQPNILILSDQTGDVAVDICISKAGRVESAEINQAESSIETPSLQNLAVRKAKEFWFERMGTKSMCGTIVFQITGR